MKDITYKTDTYQIPFEITCTISGQVKTYTSEDFINGKLDRFGGLEKLRATYVCRDAQRLHKQGKSKEEIVEMLKKGVEIPRSTPVVKQKEEKEEKVEKEVATPIIFKPEAPQPMTKESASKDTCYNPSFKLSGKACADCAMKAICHHADSPKGKLNRLVKKAA